MEINSKGWFAPPLALAAAAQGTFRLMHVELLSSQQISQAAFIILNKDFPTAEYNFYDQFILI